MKLSVYSLQKIIFQGEAESLNCKTAIGEITVLNNHDVYIGVLKPGIARIIDSQNKEHLFEIKSGFLEVDKGSKVRCIIEQ